jgi:hypothetical protein
MDNKLVQGMTKREGLIENLRLITTSMEENEFHRTSLVLSTILHDMDIPNPSIVCIRDLLKDSYLTFVEEVMEKKPLHHKCLKLIAKEMQEFPRTKPIPNPKEMFISPYGRGPLDLKNELVRIANETRDPKARTLLFCLLLIASYETDKIDVENFINWMASQYEKGLSRSSLIIQSLLSLDYDQLDWEKHNLQSKSLRCDVCRIRNGIAHFRYDLSDEGTITIWDIVENNEVFKKTLTQNQLVTLITDFRERTFILSSLSFLAVASFALGGPHADEYIRKQI